MWNTALIFSNIRYGNKKHGLQKKLSIEENFFFSVEYVKIIELHVVHTWRHMQSDQMK